MPENDAVERAAHEIGEFFLDGVCSQTEKEHVEDMIRHEQDAEGVARRACDIVWTFADRGLFYSGDWRRRLEAEITDLIRKGRTDG